jgi:hypothetical protein
MEELIYVNYMLSLDSPIVHVVVLVHYHVTVNAAHVVVAALHHALYHMFVIAVHHVVVVDRR